MSNYYKSTTKKFHELFIPAIAIIISSVIAIIMLITFFTNLEDKHTRENNARLVQTIVDNWANSSLQFAYDYSVWDEAIENIITKPDKVWIENNLFSGLKNTATINGILAITEEMKVLAYSQDHSIPFDLRNILVEEAALLIKDYNQAPESYPKGIEGHLYRDNMLISFGFHPFVFQKEYDSYKNRSEFLIIFRTSNVEQIKTAGNRLNIQDLHFAKTNNKDLEKQYVLNKATGNATVAFEWTSSSSGNKLLQKFIPILVLASGFMGLVIFTLLKRGTNIVEDLNNREEKQRHFQTALADLSEMNFASDGNLTSELNSLLEQTAHILNVENIVCWEISDDLSTAHCILCYNMRHKKYFERDAYSLKSFGIFSIEKDIKNMIIYNNIENESAMSPLVKRNLKAVHVNKIMSAPFYSKNKFRGILTAERSGKQTDFNEDEALFIRAISNTISLLLSIDSHKKLSKELTISTRKAEESNTAKSAFLANMSHELRTPLNAIIGFAEVLEHDNDFLNNTVKNREYAGLIHKSGSHLLDIVNGLLDLAKIESGKTELRETVVDLQQIWDSCSQLISNMATAKGITIICEPLPDIRMNVDERLIKQIFMNILSNSIKFTPQGGQISVVSEVSEEIGLILKFSDTGIGLEIQDIEKAFQPFSQIANHLTKTDGGTGLGLPLIKSFAEIHQGTFTLESEVGVGTTAIITIPQSRIIGENEPTTEQFI